MHCTVVGHLTLAVCSYNYSPFLSAYYIPWAFPLPSHTGACVVSFNPTCEQSALYHKASAEHHVIVRGRQHTFRYYNERSECQLHAREH